MASTKGNTEWLRILFGAWFLLTVVARRVCFGGRGVGGGTLFLVKGTRRALMLKVEEQLNSATWALAQDVLFCGLRRYGAWNPELAGLCGGSALPLETSGQGICLC